jgi:nicotinamide-nucleotide amidase
VAGPGGGSADKPVGTVWFGFALPDLLISEVMRFAGDRADVRSATVQHALMRLTALVASRQAPDRPNRPDKPDAPDTPDTPDTSLSS